MFLGVVERVTQKSGEQRTAWFRPLYEASQNHSKWTRAVEDSKAEFPNRGLVAWWNALDTAHERTFWQFGIKPSPTFSPSMPAHARYNAIDPAEVIPVLDGRSFAADNEEIRERMTSTGIILPSSPAERVYLRLHGNEWIGTIRLVERGRAWLIDPELVEEPLRVFEMANPDAVLRLEFQGTRLFPGPNSRPGRFVRLVDWAPDAVVLRRVLRRLRDFDSEYAAHLKLTAAAADRIAERLGAGWSGPDSQLDIQRLSRVKRFLPRLAERSDLVAEVVEELLTLDAVRPDLERRQAEILAEYREEVRARIARETETARLGLEELMARKASLGEEVSGVQKKLAELQTRLDRRVATFETALGERLRELAANPERVFADLASIRVAFGGQSTAGTMVPVVIRGPVFTETAVPEGIGAKEEQEVVNRDLRQRFVRAGFAASFGDTLHATFIAGDMPLLLGGRSFAALSLYASRVTGRKVFWTPVAADVVSPIDLLGGVRAAENGEDLGGASLLEFLGAASMGDDLHLVILDGVNVAAMETYLVPILALYRDAQIGSLMRPLRFEARDGRRVDLAWPGNVLLAGVCRDGVATLPVPRSAWSGVVLLDIESFDGAAVDGEMHPDDRDAIVASWPGGSMSVGLWLSLRGGCREQDLAEVVTLWSEAREKFRLPSDSKEQVMRLVAAGRLVSSREVAWGGATRAMLPYVVRELDAFVAWMRERNLVPDSEARMFSNLQKLVG